jgi:peptidoglycan/LPS O-acetylase OafA/YrhL
MDRLYRPELDVLRFVAFGLVFAFHNSYGTAVDSFAHKAVSGGAFGVDLFFLLSAYLITELFRRETMETGRIDVAAFYWRRALRIWPLYFSFITVVLAASYLVTAIQMPAGATIALLAFYGNWYLTSHPFFSPAGILWSVSVEEQFYACAPWAMRFLSPRALVISAIGLIGAAVAARLVVVGNATWFATITRLDPIAIGIVVALVLRGQAPDLSGPARVGLAVLGLPCLYVAAVWFNGAIPQNVTDSTVAYPVADIGVLTLFFAFLGAPVAWKPLVYLGRISYGLYVFHLLALDLTKVGLDRMIGTCPWALRGAIALPLTIVLAAASYRWLELPFLRLKNRLRGSNSSDSRRRYATRNRPIPYLK